MLPRTQHSSEEGKAGPYTLLWGSRPANGDLHRLWGFTDRRHLADAAAGLSAASPPEHHVTLLHTRPLQAFCDTNGDARPEIWQPYVQACWER